MTIRILILILCLILGFAWILTGIASEKSVRIMPVLLTAEGILSVILLILSFSYRKMLFSVLLTAFFFFYLFYLICHKEAEYQPDRKLLVFSFRKFGRFSCELKEIYSSPEAFPHKKELHAYRTPDDFIMLRCPDTEEEFFAYQFTNYSYLLDGKKQNCLVIGTADVRKLPLSAYHRKHFFPCAEHLLYTVLITLLVIPVLSVSMLRQNSENLEHFLKYQAETSVTAVSESSAETYRHENFLTLVITKSETAVEAIKLLKLNTEKAEIEIITIQPDLIQKTSDYKLLKDIFNTEDFSQIKTAFQDIFGIAVDHIITLENDRLLTAIPPEQSITLELSPEQSACSGIGWQESGIYTIRETDGILKGLEQYLASEEYDRKILSENQLAVMQNQFILSLLTSAVQGNIPVSESKPFRTTMTQSEIKQLYDTLMLSESRYRNCFYQEKYSTVLPSAEDCTRLDVSSRYVPDSVLRYRMIQALYY
ncbi:MAG: hypothetical protein IJ642_09045 [Oscillospiraceae bacterium]|nr:hypothetical protein [Oscillospiraceae bacterium]